MVYGEERYESSLKLKRYKVVGGFDGEIKGEMTTKGVSG